jgi:hypothetical protein
VNTKAYSVPNNTTYENEPTKYKQQQQQQQHNTTRQTKQADMQPEITNV